VAARGARWLPPRLTISGRSTFTVADPLRSDLLAVVGEALSNVVKHGTRRAVAIDVGSGPARSH